MIVECLVPGSAEASLKTISPENARVLIEAINSRMVNSEALQKTVLSDTWLFLARFQLFG